MEVDEQRATGLVREDAVRVTDRHVGSIGSLHCPDIWNDVKSRHQTVSPTKFYKGVENGNSKTA